MNDLQTILAIILICTFVGITISCIINKDNSNNKPSAEDKNNE